MSPPSKEGQPTEYETAYVIHPSILWDSDMTPEVEFNWVLLITEALWFISNVTSLPCIPS